MISGNVAVRIIFCYDKEITLTNKVDNIINNMKPAAITNNNQLIKFMPMHTFH